MVQLDDHEELAGGMPTDPPSNAPRRRRVPRQAAGWPGRYKFESASDQPWGRCRVLDISVIGAGVEIFGEAPTEIVGTRLVVEVQTPAGASVSIRLVGETRNAGRGPEGGIRVGLEFVDLSATERSILDALERMQVVW